MQQAICPLCGGVMTLEPQPAKVACSHCGGSLQAVMNGRAVILKEIKAVRQEDPRALKWAEKIAGAADPVKRYEMLCQALAEHPDSLSLNREMLFHGRLHERDPRHIDYSKIKCYLLHVFEEPAAYDEARRRQIYEELFEGEQLKKCMALAPDGEAFYQDYLQELSARYVEIFLKGSSRHVTSIFGIPLTKPEKSLSLPASRMIRAMGEEPTLPPPVRDAMAEAFRRGYHQVLGSTAYLDALL